MAQKQFDNIEFDTESDNKCQNSEGTSLRNLEVAGIPNSQNSIQKNHSSEGSAVEEDSSSRNLQTLATFDEQDSPSTSNSEGNDFHKLVGKRRRRKTNRNKKKNQTNKKKKKIKRKATRRETINIEDDTRINSLRDKLAIGDHEKDDTLYLKERDGYNSASKWHQRYNIREDKVEIDSVRVDGNSVVVTLSNNISKWTPINLKITEVSDSINIDSVIENIDTDNNEVTENNSFDLADNFIMNEQQENSNVQINQPVRLTNKSKQTTKVEETNIRNEHLFNMNENNETQLTIKSNANIIKSVERDVMEKIERNKLEIIEQSDSLNVTTCSNEVISSKIKETNQEYNIKYVSSGNGTHGEQKDTSCDCSKRRESRCLSFEKNSNYNHLYYDTFDRSEEQYTCMSSTVQASNTSNLKNDNDSNVCEKYNSDFYEFCDSLEEETCFNSVDYHQYKKLDSELNPVKERSEIECEISVQTCDISKQDTSSGFDCNTVSKFESQKSANEHELATDSKTLLMGPCNEPKKAGSLAEEIQKVQIYGNPQLKITNCEHESVKEEIIMEKIELVNSPNDSDAHIPMDNFSTIVKCNSNLKKLINQDDLELPLLLPHTKYLIITYVTLLLMISLAEWFADNSLLFLLLMIFYLFLQ